jgi:hypothetical protein
MMKGHETHRVWEFEPCDIHNGAQWCIDCGVQFVMCKHPVEYIYLKLDIDEEGE